MNKTVARKIVATARPHGNKWVASFAVPGTEVSDIKSSDGTPALYNTEFDALTAARELAIRFFNRPRENNKEAGISQSARFGGGRPTKLTGAQLSVALGLIGMGPKTLAFIADKRIGRVMDWIDGIQDIPHEISLIIALCEKFDGAAEYANTYTEGMIAITEFDTKTSQVNQV